MEPAGHTLQRQAAEGFGRTGIAGPTGLRAVYCVAAVAAVRRVHAGTFVASVALLWQIPEDLQPSVPFVSVARIAV
jgi:hypothetical protein